MPPQANKQERKLIKTFKSLNASNKEALQAFGEFLQTRAGGLSVNSVGEFQDSSEGSEIEAVASEPLDIPRAENESVIKGIKRLTATYPMVDKENILHPISNLMTSHIIQGRSASEVIDDLETLFLKEYKSLAKAPANHKEKNNKVEK